MMTAMYHTLDINYS